MDTQKIALQNGLAVAEVTCFAPAGKVAEWHVILHVSPAAVNQLQTLLDAESELLTEHLSNAVLIARRRLLKEPSAVEYAVGQRPLDGSAAAEWLYLNDCGAAHNGYRHFWNLGMALEAGDSAAEATTLLENYETALEEKGLSIADDCIRTWFFVHDIDNNYAGLVRARRENFIREGLTEKTHYIASTGICGTPHTDGAVVQMDAYAVSGLEKGQTGFLYAPTHLNPTYEYGVTFERGTSVQYGDRKHVFISGTASIDNKGEVLYVGDVKAQTLRMWENVEKLLEEAGAGFGDVMQIIVYLRNAEDYEAVAPMFAEKFPDTPYVITLAPVCRPAWLIEMECIAVTPEGCEAFRNL